MIKVIRTHISNNTTANHIFSAATAQNQVQDCNKQTCALFLKQTRG